MGQGRGDNVRKHHARWNTANEGMQKGVPTGSGGQLKDYYLFPNNSGSSQRFSRQGLIDSYFFVKRVTLAAKAELSGVPLCVLVSAWNAPPDPVSVRSG